jgi:two-component system phosphate regulon sensor histidine kinase PhoR
VVAAALVPLLVLLVLQYQWLERLERVSEVAHRATLENYLEAVSSAVEYHYRSQAERVLELPAAIFTSDRLEKAGYYFQKKGSDVAGRLFVVSLVGEKAGQPLFYDKSSKSLVVPEWSDDLRAVYVAIAPWKMLAMKHGTLERPTLQVEEREPERRMILNPITDDATRLVALAGLIVDRDDFERTVLPKIVGESLPKFFGEMRKELPLLTVRDGAGRQLDLGEKLPTRPEEASRRLGFPFRDFQVGIHSRYYTPADWARRNFLINLALSVVLTAVVAGGVLFALRAAAREMRLSQMKSDFVSNVSHELRTPLASIRVFGELLRLGKVEAPEKVREYGELIETESRRLTGLINNILDLARIESGRKSYEMEPADLEQVVAETLRTFRVSLAQSGFRIAFRPPAEPLPPMTIDAQAVAQAVGNLLDNAVKYSGAAKDVEVGVERAGAWARVWVRDQGVGIPREEQPKIFDRFHRVASGLVHDVKGSGLGLAIVRHVVEAHRGRIEVESAPGSGSTFSILLPTAGLATLAEPAAGGRASEA